MNILFVASGNSKNLEIAPFIKTQGESLNKQSDLEVHFLPIIGKGVQGYFRNRKRIREYVKNNDIDIVHAHYVLSGWAAVLSRCNKPIVLSLMGNDAYGDYKGKKASMTSRYLTILTWLIQPFVDIIISKSENIASYVYQKSKSHIIPNGIELEKVKRNQGSDTTNIRLDSKKTNILFLGDPNNPRKNFKLIEDSINRLADSNIELIVPYPTDHDSVLKYLNAVDVFVMASYMEGSPNVVKEAMACNCPMVVTDVGDASWVVKDVEGCYVGSFDVVGYTEKLKQAIQFSKQHGETDGLKKINKLGLDSESVAKKIVEIYRNI